MTIHQSIRRGLGLTAIMAFGACNPTPEDDVPIAEPSVTPVAEVVAQPDTTSDGIWAHLTAAEYRENWRLWPGKDELYTGVDPHGMLLTTYANDVAFAALSAGSTQLPEGSVVVKENFMPDSTLAAVTTMYRVRGYNPEHQDWFFAKHDPAGVVEVAGRDPMCQGCHAGAPGADYLFTELPR